MINYIDTPPNHISNNMLENVDSGANINLAKQTNPTMASVIISNDMKARLPDRSTIESSHVVTLQLPGLSKQARQIHIFPKIQTSPLLLLGVLCKGLMHYHTRQTRNVNPEEWKRNNQSHKKKRRLECGKYPWGHNNQKLW